MRFWFFSLLIIIVTSINLLFSQIWDFFQLIDLIFLVVFYAARYSSSRRAIILGWLAGFVQDWTLSLWYPLGLFSTTKMLVAAITSFLNRHFNLEHLWIQTVLIWVLLLFHHSMVLLIFAVFGQDAPVQWSMDLFWSASFTACLNVIPFLVVKKFHLSSRAIIDYE